MSKKKFILNADDFGMSKDINKAVLESYETGLLKSVSLTTNGEAFEEAVSVVLPKCPELGVGIHLNIIEGKSLCSDLKTLTDENNIFNNSFLKLLIKAYMPKNEEFFEDIEREFRRQIETAMTNSSISHIDSHVHTHSIPPIFDIVCRLAKEYGIKQVRSQYEKTYIVPNRTKLLTLKYPINLIKVLLLNIFTLINKSTLLKWKLNSNDYLIGVTYTSMMDALTVLCGVSVINDENATVEALIHPKRYENGTVDNHFDEYLLTKNKKLKEKIENLGYKITNYVEK